MSLQSRTCGKIAAAEQNNVDFFERTEIVPESAERGRISLTSGHGFLNGTASAVPQMPQLNDGFSR
jgi:hypothetical protein